MFDINQVIQRMQIATGCENDSQLARFLGTGNSTVIGWKTRNKVPADQCVQISLKTGYSLNWLIFGKGEKLINAEEIKSPGNLLVVSESEFVDEYAETYTVGIEMSILAPGTQYDTESLQFLGKKMYRKLANNTAPIVRASETHTAKQG